MLSRPLRCRAGLPFVHLVRAYAVPANTHVPRKKKVWNSVDEAVSIVKSGDVLLSGGALLFQHQAQMLNTIVRFWPLRYTRWVIWQGSRNRAQSLDTYTTDTLIGALAARGDVRNLTAVSNNAGSGLHGLGACSSLYLCTYR